MVDVAQSVELRIVDPAVVGSNPIVHPKSRRLSMDQALAGRSSCPFTPEQTDYAQRGTIAVREPGS